jgi:hypothetical protein
MPIPAAVMLASFPENGRRLVVAAAASTRFLVGWGGSFAI